MPDPSPITAPAGYATAYAVGYADPAENLAVEGTIEAQNNAVVHATMRSSANTESTIRDTRIAGGNLAANGLVLVVEIWSDTSGSIGTQLVKIAGQKAGMRNVPVFG